jgi:hypothetical protein
MQRGRHASKEDNTARPPRQQGSLFSLLALRAPRVDALAGAAASSAAGSLRWAVLRQHVRDDCAARY